MKRNLLYYPTLTFPKKWLYGSLFYCDTVSSIYPNDGINKEDHEILEFLSAEGQYRSFRLSELIQENPREFKKFGDKFKSALDSDLFRINNRNSRKVNISEVDPYIWSKMYYPSKQISLLKKYTTGSEIDESVALFYLGSLAQFLAENDTNDLTIPSTDDKRYQNIVYKSPDKHVMSLNVILKNCLPIPDTSVDIKTIINFKKKRYAELLEFRTFISEFQEKIVNADSEFHIKQIQVECIESIKANLKRLNRLFKETKIVTVLTSFESLLGVENPKLFQAITLAGAIATTFNPIAGIATGVMGVSGGMIATYLQKKREIDFSKFSYVFHAQQGNEILFEESDISEWLFF